MKAFEVLNKMDDEKLLETAQRLGVTSQDREEVIAELLANGYDPEAPVKRLAPLLIGIKSCDTVFKALEIFRSNRFRERLVAVPNRYGQINARRMQTIRLKDETVAKLHQDGVLVPAEKDRETFEEMIQSPDVSDNYLVRRPGRGNRFYVTLTMQPKNLDPLAEAKKYQEQRL